ncbi:hypothetical protein ACSHT2_16995 [Bradyrhizobium sp. PUT101]|uniref:hypothetical protein n=1 Tax=Bradyrhizobium sp. PUT101 TaxID=3447427 RepID=UPI003F8747EF
MPVGLPEVEGAIDVGRFCPAGRSDADTAKVLVTVAPDAIRFRENDTAPFQPTDVFEGAKVKGRTSTPPIKNGKLTVRLQGIDAPELHYMPSPLSAYGRLVGDIEVTVPGEKIDINHWLASPACGRGRREAPGEGFFLLRRVPWQKHPLPGPLPQAGEAVHL